MKVLQVNCVYGVGSTGKITAEIHSGLQKNGIDSIVCYGRGESTEQIGVYKTCGELYSKINHFFAKLRGQLYGGCFLSTDKLIAIIKREKPDVVHLQCINGYFVNIFKLLGWLKKNHIKTVLTLHAEFMYTANCGHARECERWKTGCGKCPQLKTDLGSFGIDGTHSSWKKMNRAFRGFQKNLIVVSVSPWLKMRAMQSPFLNDKKQCVVMNGLDTSVFYPRLVETLRQQHDSSKKTILYVTTTLTEKENDLKGGHYVLKLAEQLKKENVCILVAGYYDKTIHIPSNMVMLGRLDNQDTLAQYYSMANLTILTSKRETFSMVVAESLCCGTPVVGFQAGGPESIALPEYSEFVEQGDIVALKKAVLHMLSQKIERKEVAKSAENVYSGERMVREYVRIYEELVEEKNG